MFRIILYISAGIFFVHDVVQYIMIRVLLYYMMEKNIEPSDSDLKHCKDEVIRHIIQDLI